MLKSLFFPPLGIQEMAVAFIFLKALSAEGRFPQKTTFLNSC